MGIEKESMEGLNEGSGCMLPTSQVMGLNAKLIIQRNMVASGLYLSLLFFNEVFCPH